MLIDLYGRPLKSLRICVTTRCNYRCIYCHSEGVDRSIDSELTPEEIEIVARAASRLGISDFKLTGGEPLVRQDIIEIVSRLSRYGEVSITTNGFFLADLAGRLAEAGLKRVNVSVPSTRRSRYSYITKVDALNRVLDGIRAAYDYSLKPITINTVVLKSLNDDELDDLLNLATRFEARLRLIELEPIASGSQIFANYYRSLEDFEKIIAERAVRSYKRELNGRNVYVLDNGIEVEFVRWVSKKEFCYGCYRVRLDPDGRLRPCIAVDDGIDLRYALRPYPREKDVVEAITLVNLMRRPFYR